MNKNSHKPVWQRNGELWPMSVPTSMTWNDIGAVLMAIQEYCVTTVIEIGVEHGGLASILLARKSFTPTNPRRFQYFGIEWDREKIYSTLNSVLSSEDEIIRIGNAFSDGSVIWVQNIIQRDTNRVLIVCDGGDKPREMKTYAPLLREGDIIMAHDYGQEITWRDIPSDVAVLSKEWMLDTNLVLARKK